MYTLFDNFALSDITQPFLIILLNYRTVNGKI